MDKFDISEDKIALAEEAAEEEGTAEDEATVDGDFVTDEVSVLLGEDCKVCFACEGEFDLDEIGEEVLLLFFFLLDLGDFDGSTILLLFLAIHSSLSFPCL